MLKQYYTIKKVLFSFFLNLLWTLLLFQHRDPMLKKRDDFEDILEERRRSSDLRYALKCYTPVLYKGLVPCKAHMLKDTVLQSDQLRYVISQVKRHFGSLLFWLYCRNGLSLICLLTNTVAEQYTMPVDSFATVLGSGTLYLLKLWHQHQCCV